MFLFVATALAGAGTTFIGWPCQRLNWGWRNVWSTCSINSYAPSGTGTEAAATIPTGFRFLSTAVVPTTVLNSAGVFTPATGAAPGILCTNAPATGTGATSALRNRCRRAIDAYGALVKSCQATPQLAGNRGPSTLNTPDYAPSSGHQPHVQNVQGLTWNAQFCLLPAGANAPANLNTPSNTCPGLLGWFTVVFNACGFSNAPSLTAPNQAAPATAPYISNFVPLAPGAGSINFANIGGGTFSPNTGAGYFCQPGAAGIPSIWNTAGTAFRTSRCRKALDQFGRTAQRCHASPVGGAAGPAQAGGYSDPLRFLAVGVVPSQSPQSPTGLNVWAPACN